MTNPVVSSTAWPKVADVDAFFASITPQEIGRYKAYWATLAPEDYLETFERWLFAFCSVHTTWSANVRGFALIKPWFGWQQDTEELKRRLTDSRMGLHINRTRFIAQFCDHYWKSPSKYYKQPAETWVACRDRLVKDILGLGIAKVSFALELIYPCNAQVVCLDTHMFQLYGLDQTKHARHYPALERHWVGHCAHVDVPPAVARAIFWDRKQKKPDSRYWTHILERSPDQAPSTTTIITS